jgi:PKD repeat protein
MHRGQWVLSAATLVISAVVALVLAAGSHSASTVVALPSGFQESVVFSGLGTPTKVRFASDGRVFVIQKDGVLKVFDSLSDTTPTTVLDIRTEVHDYWDRGLLGLALDPNFPATPYVYLMYTYDALIGGTAPRWNDACPTPPGPTTDGCVVTGRLVRLTLSGNTVAAQKILIKDQWCQQYPSHSIGDLNFGADGALYVSGGEGASFTFADYGQGGGGSGSPTPKNPCGDPPAGVGGTMTPPTAEGGALRSQSLRRPAGEPVVLSGAVLRVDPSTGDALPDNPLASSSDANARRIVAYGFRNPFRFAIRPLSNDLWVGDVGWNTWEEIDRQPSPTSSVLNFGWPCYEGGSPQPGYQSAGLSLCSSLYAAGTATAPVLTYNHSAHVVTGDSCPTGSSSVTGLAFYTGAGNYPASYTGGLFFGDYSRGCIWFIPKGTNGLPDPTKVQTFATGAAGPVDLEIGPNGDLFYADLNNGTIRRIKYVGGNNPPTAVASASPTSGSAPLTVNFNGSGSSDPDGNTISYSWDLNGDGTFGDATAANPSFTYATAGTYSAVLKVTDSQGASTLSTPIAITVTSGGSSTFGTTTPGTSTDSASVNLKEVSKYTAPQAGSVLKLTGYLSGLGAGSGSQPVRAVLYADSGGNPGALLGVSSPVTITAGRAWGWVDFTFPAPVAIQAGTIWMGYIAGTVSDLTQLRYDTSLGELRWNVNSGGYAAGPSNPFGSANISNIHYSLYATYTSSSGAPVPTITSPASTLTWKVGDLITFSGQATDPQDGTLPSSSLSWLLILHHCDPTGQTCHIHQLQTFAGVSSGSFNAPDHGYPSHLELQLTATDSQGTTATTSVTIEPQPVNLTFTSAPSGLQAVVDGSSQTTPFAVTAIIGSTHSLSAPATQTLGGTTYTFSSWSDGGAATHNVTAPASATTYTATYTGSNSPPIAMATASPTSGTAPLTVNFDGSGSSDPDAGNTISYSWDLNGDGTFGDSTAQKPSYTYTTAGTYNAVLKVTDNNNASTLSAPIAITVSAGGGSSTFGTTQPGALTDLASANYKEVAKYTAPLAGNVTKVTGYISGLGSTSGSQPVRAVIYADSGGNPGALLGVSTQVTIAAGKPWGWVNFTFTSPVTVQAGTIWMGYIAGTKHDLTQLRYEQIANDTRYNLNAGGYSAGATNPFGSATTTNKHYSMYGTYG